MDISNDINLNVDENLGLNVPRKMSEEDLEDIRYFSNMKKREEEDKIIRKEEFQKENSIPHPKHYKLGRVKVSPPDMLIEIGDDPNKEIIAIPMNDLKKVIRFLYEF